MGGITSGSMPLLVVEERTGGGTAFCTFNEGVGRVLRFGANGPEVLDRLRWLRDVAGPALGAALRLGEGIDLRAIMGRALTMGDEMHQRNVAATLLLLREVAPLLAGAGLPSDRQAAVVAFVGQTDQFFLNVAMAACKAIADAGHAAGAESSLVTAMSRNGVEFGVRLGGRGDRWFTAPVNTPQGLYFGGYSAADGNPDIGDSAITETVGVGAFCMAAAPGRGAVRRRGRLRRRDPDHQRDAGDHGGPEPGLRDPGARLRRRPDRHRRAAGRGDRASSRSSTPASRTGGPGWARSAPVPCARRSPVSSRRWSRSPTRSVDRWGQQNRIRCGRVSGPVRSSESPRGDALIQRFVLFAAMLVLVAACSSGSEALSPATKVSSPPTPVGSPQVATPTAMLAVLAPTSSPNASPSPGALAARRRPRSAARRASPVAAASPAAILVTPGAAPNPDGPRFRIVAERSEALVPRPRDVREPAGAVGRGRPHEGGRGRDPAGRRRLAARADPEHADRPADADQR